MYAGCFLLKKCIENTQVSLHNNSFVKGDYLHDIVFPLMVMTSVGTFIALEKKFQKFYEVEPIWAYIYWYIHDFDFAEENKQGCIKSFDCLIYSFMVEFYWSQIIDCWYSGKSHRFL